MSAEGDPLSRSERLGADERADRKWRDAADLVERIQAGDQDAEAEFVRRYRRGVTVIITRLSRNRSVIDDLAQETLTTALERVRAGVVRGPDRLSGFVAGIARNLVIEHFRKQSSRTAIEVRLGAEAPAPPAAIVDELIDRERAAIVRTVLEELESERDREILFRFYIAEHEKEEICRDLGLTPLHFNRVLFRARERYRVLYQQRTAAGGRGKPR
jgi:RNA polymerase sigma-70 factor (ECF subfamily)